MAGTAAAPPLAPISSSVEADWFEVGTTRLEAVTEKQGGGMLAEQVPFPFDRGSGIQVTYLVAAPSGPLMSMPSARPSTVLFGALSDPQYRLRRPIPLDVTVEEGHVVVNWAEIEEFGTGDTLSAAIADFAYALRDLHRYLSKIEELGPDLANIKHILGEYIEARPR